MMHRDTPNKILFNPGRGATDHVKIATAKRAIFLSSRGRILEISLELKNTVNRGFEADTRPFRRCLVSLEDVSNLDTG